MKTNRLLQIKKEEIYYSKRESYHNSEKTYSS